MADEKTKGGKTGDTGVVVIKKYANRRLYNTRTSAYAVSYTHLTLPTKRIV